ncbi:hypothetical protein HKT18_04440 [Flavobacterium sp. IMCC34852]|uniref:Uncharacterized protein n=1 Tax=Flavobacterium rivulicola TaxID=2732161 RepID=A0A7Y3VYJ2_9FLAO|nr:hypothetical protein [Flavobacterium sp. IMCC34852]NNT71461.1 hypothetical protein [Flavobacterium sp. IMCC34852]
MGNLFLMSDFLSWIILFLLFASPIVFVIGIILVAVSKDTRKFGVKLIIGSVIALIIGFGTCIASMNAGGL